MDLAIVQDPQTGAFRLSLSGTDLATDVGLRPAVIYSLFTARRAEASDEIPDGTADRRGSWQDSYLVNAGDSEGSRMWLLAREKTTQQVLDAATAYAEESLQWLLDDGIARAVSVTAIWSATRRGCMEMTVEISRAAGGKYQETFTATLQQLPMAA